MRLASIVLFASYLLAACSDQTNDPRDQATGHALSKDLAQTEVAERATVASADALSEGSPEASDQLQSLELTSSVDPIEALYLIAYHAGGQDRYVLGLARDLRRLQATTTLAYSQGIIGKVVNADKFGSTDGSGLFCFDTITSTARTNQGSYLVRAALTRNNQTWCTLTPQAAQTITSANVQLNSKYYIGVSKWIPGETAFGFMFPR